ncbi:hypothetical protein OGN88_002961 [Vibrio cholerae]|nr:hypothetical protein [Vibrio cholerae]
MFSLIISIIAIALVAALALASIYYGGSAFQEGSTDAEASTVINQGQQLQGAATLADVDEVTLASIDDLKPTYVKDIPTVRSESWTLNTTDNVFELRLYNLTDGYVLNDVCDQINEEAGIATKPTTAAGVTAQFGCFDAATNTPVAVYKL